MESAESFEILTREPNRILKRNENESVYYLEETHDLYYQIQLQMNVVELKYCDLIFWSPKPNLDHLIITINVDVNFWNSNMKRAEKFHEQVMMPEILGKSFTRTGRFQLTLPIDRSNYDDTNIVAHKLESRDTLTHASSASIQYETDEKNGKDYSLILTNLFTEFGEIGERNLMKDSNEYILKTFFDHEDQLKQLYDVQIIQLKRNYRPKYLPSMIELDIVNERQLQAMAVFAEARLANNLDEETNSTDVIFDAILPEWVLAAFCRKFNYTRADAIALLKMQAQASTDMDISH